MNEITCCARFAVIALVSCTSKQKVDKGYGLIVRQLVELVQVISVQVNSIHILVTAKNKVEIFVSLENLFADRKAWLNCVT